MNNRQAIQLGFPGLATAPFNITSPKDRDYNCIAWAAGDSRNWWWPLPGKYWPAHAPRVVTLQAFELAYAGLGYAVCVSEVLEEGFEKVAVFVDSAGEPTHAARQLPNGSWTSKLGPSHDITHSLRDVEGNLYGTVALIMKRMLAAASIETR